MEWNAIILAGGRATRLGGIDKTSLVFDGSSLLERARAATSEASSVVVVGDSVVESPRYSGPASATVAGLDALPRPRAAWTAVIASDQPYVGSALPLLLTAVRAQPYVGGVIAVDDTGRRQPLLAVYSTAALALAAAELRPRLENLPMSALIAPLRLRELRLPARLCTDIDTPAAARAHGIVLEGAAHGL